VEKPKSADLWAISPLTNLEGICQITDRYLRERDLAAAPEGDERQVPQ
jgi:hypothetical protein